MNRPMNDLSGMRFGRLTALRPTPRRNASRYVIWECVCDCGGVVETPSDSLLKDRARSCGCLRRTQWMCSIAGCDRKAHSKQMCNMHYKRFAETGDPARSPKKKTSYDIRERFSLKTKRTPSGCIEWTGTRSKDGYGQTTWRGVGYNTHRLAWEIANGRIREGLQVCHKCDNPPCCNLDHLFLGTALHNAQDAIRKGRRK